LPLTELEDFSSIEEENLSLSAFFCELEEFLETSSLLLETSAIGSGSVLLEPLSHAVNTAKTRAMARSMDSRFENDRPKMDCFALTGLAMTFVKIFTEDLQ
jgi:hypothetical protein